MIRSFVNIFLSIPKLSPSLSSIFRFEWNRLPLSTHTIPSLVYNSTYSCLKNITLRFEKFDYWKHYSAKFQIIIPFPNCRNSKFQVISTDTHATGSRPAVPLSIHRWIHSMDENREPLRFAPRRGGKEVHRHGVDTSACRLALNKRSFSRIGAGRAREVSRQKSGIGRWLIHGGKIVAGLGEAKRDPIVIKYVFFEALCFSLLHPAFEFPPLPRSFSLLWYGARIIYPVRG